MIDKTPIDLSRINAYKIKRPITHIVIHHSATVDGRTFSWPAIKKYHLAKGWQDIGYNIGVELVDDRVKVLYGRSLFQAGAHCTQENLNFKSVGICIVGNHDLIVPPHEHWIQALRITKAVMDCFHIPAENVRGHNEFAPKSCPGKLFSMESFRRELKTVSSVKEVSNNILKGTLNLDGLVFDVEMRLTKHG